MIKNLTVRIDDGTKGRPALGGGRRRRGKTAAQNTLTMSADGYFCSVAKGKGSNSDGQKTQRERRDEAAMRPRRRGRRE